ncbi:unnamed protein product [Effrenium voratum]|nr:unnamed protein product [Effrenium voratum]
MVDRRRRAAVLLSVALMLIGWMGPAYAEKIGVLSLTGFLSDSPLAAALLAQSFWALLAFLPLAGAKSYRLPPLGAAWFTAGVVALLSVVTHAMWYKSMTGTTPAINTLLWNLDILSALCLEAALTLQLPPRPVALGGCITLLGTTVALQTTSGTNTWWGCLLCFLATTQFSAITIYISRCLDQKCNLLIFMYMEGLLSLAALGVLTLLQVAAPPLSSAWFNWPAKTSIFLGLSHLMLSVGWFSSAAFLGAAATAQAATLSLPISLALDAALLRASVSQVQLAGSFFVVLGLWVGHQSGAPKEADPLKAQVYGASSELLALRYSFASLGMLRFFGQCAPSARRARRVADMVNVTSAPCSNIRCAAASVKEDGKRVQVEFTDGAEFELHGLWLRDACRDENFVSEVAGERYLTRTAFKEKQSHADGKVADAKVVEGSLQVKWANEGSLSEVASIFPSNFLRTYAGVVGRHLKGDRHHTSKEAYRWLEPYSGFKGAPAPDLKLKSLFKSDNFFQRRDYKAVINSDESNLEMAQALVRHGVVIMENVPTPVAQAKDNSVLLNFVDQCLGGMQKDPARKDPNWVIQKKADALSVSYSQEKRLNNHTDQSVPAHGIPALLLVVNYVSGSGYNTLVDGYAVAEALRERDPNAFRLLSTYGNCQERDFVRSRVDSVQEGTQTMLINTKQPIINTDDKGNVIRVQFNEVFRTPTTIPFDDFEDWYRAYYLWNDMIHSPEFEVEVSLGQGQMLILDNWRVLHGRAGGRSSSDRVIMGGTVVREAFMSRAIRLMGAYYPIADYAAHQPE